MKKLFPIGRICYGIAVAETGLQTIYYHDFPYWLAPPKHAGLPGITLLAYLIGIVMLLSGLCIVFEKKTRQASLILGALMLLIFFFWHVPYELISGSKFLSLLPSENALKELSVASGALVIASFYSANDEQPWIKLLAKLIPSGTIIFSFTMICFGMAHLLYADQVSGYVPAWVPNPVLWVYLGGVGLVGPGIAIILKIKVELVATLMGSMILTWFIILHIPRIVVSPIPYLGSEITSAMLALAYGGIAFVLSAGPVFSSQAKAERIG